MENQINIEFSTNSSSVVRLTHWTDIKQSTIQLQEVEGAD